MTFANFVKHCVHEGLFVKIDPFNLLYSKPFK